MTPDSEARCDLAPDFFDPVLFDDGTGDEAIFGQSARSRAISVRLFTSWLLDSLSLLVRRMRSSMPDAMRPVMHLTILRAGSSPHVEQEKDQPERIGALEIAAYELAPRARHVLRDFRVAVTGEVDDVEALVDQIELNGLRLPGVWLTRATAFRFRTALIRLDFPTLERPTIANCGRRSVGKSSGLYAARWNSTVRMSKRCCCHGKCKSRGTAKR